MVGFVPRAYDRERRNDDSERNDATNNPMCAVGVVAHVAAPICVWVVLIGHDCQRDWAAEVPSRHAARRSSSCALKDQKVRLG